ncbi:MAG: hypothetical protein A2Z14_05725 [Chloroflexi bacterium RBG_16_48_8]|nr:MAG: hypothetical protein A2Z14_05725 [Chloroflexi bacterium RBG_16_48_8]
MRIGLKSRLFTWLVILILFATMAQLLGQSMASASVPKPQWADLQLQLIQETGTFIEKLQSFQKPDGSLFSETSIWSADDEIEYFYYFPAYIYASGDQVAYDFYSDEVMYYWHRIVNGDANNGYFASPTYDTEHTLEALMGLANLAYIDPTDTEITSRLEDLMEHVGNWDSSIVDWYDWDTHHMLSTRLGTSDIFTGCPEGIDSPWNLRFVPMAIAAALDDYATGNNGRYETWMSDYLNGWIDAKARMNSSHGYDVIPSSVNPATGEPGFCGEWHEGVAGSWSDGGFPSERSFRQAFIGYWMISQDETYLNAAKEMVIELMRLGDGTCPASVFDGSSWIVDCEDDHIARLAVQAAAHDNQVDQAFDSLINEWFNSGRINEPIVDLWKYRNSGDISIVSNHLSSALSDIRNKINRLQGLDNNSEFQDYLRNNCSGKNMGDKLISCFSIEKQATALAFSAFMGFRPNEADLPEMEVKYHDSDLSLGLPNGVAGLVLSGDEDSKKFLLYNDSGQTQTIKVQAEYIARGITSLRINGANSGSFNPQYASITIEPQNLLDVEIFLSSVTPQCSGDLTGDGKIDQQDVSRMVNAVLMGNPDNLCIDLNGDSKENILDLQELINRTLGK